MNGHSVRKLQSARRWAAAFVLTSMVGATACSTGGEPDVKPTTARIQVEGSTPAPLQLVISTDFYEILDDVNFEILQVVRQADTLFIDLPFDQTFSLTSEGNLLVALTNHEAVPAQIRMRVELDSGQDPFDQNATMSEGGTLRYVFTFLETVL